MPMELERINQMIEQARDVITVRRVFGEPVERDGTVVIPAASVVGGAGGGGGDDGKGAIGAGSGFAVRARPVGAFVISNNGSVRWEPVVDRERQVVINAAIAGGALVLARLLFRRRRRRH